MNTIKYDIAISFAGEDREYVRDLVDKISSKDLTVFYDEFEEDNLWGKDLYEYLSDVYSKQAQFCIMVLSKNYIKKNWTRHERKAAQARAFEDCKEYILPLRLDDAVIPGMLSTTGFIDATKKTTEEISKLVQLKIKKRHVEQLANDPEIELLYKKDQSLLIAIRSLNPKLALESCFAMANIDIVNKCKRKLSITNIELKIKGLD